MMAPIIFMANIETLKRGEGGFICEFLQMFKKYLIDLSVPNFNVADCSLLRLAPVPIKIIDNV